MRQCDRALRSPPPLMDTPRGGAPSPRRSSTARWAVRMTTLLPTAAWRRAFLSPPGPLVLTPSRRVTFARGVCTAPLPAAAFYDSVRFFTPSPSWWQRVEGARRE